MSADRGIADRLQVNLDLSIPALLTAYRSGTLTPRQVLADVQARARQLNAEYHVYIELLDDAQLEPYLSQLDSTGPDALPLYGIPFAIKDNIDLVGVHTTASCPAHAYRPMRSAAVVERLIALGAVPTGKTNLDQFATGLNGLRSPYGECPNSVLSAYPSGGSSSGSALAVALNLASFALGTDTAGSGRVPAALNALVGCKPTRGLISTRGLVPCCPSLDCVSLFTRDADEAAQLLALSTAQDPGDPWSRRNPAWNAAAGHRPPPRSLAPFHFGVPRPENLVWLGCTESPVLYRAARARLESLGGSAIEIDFSPFLAAAQLLYEPAGVAERFASFGSMLERGKLLPVIRDVIASGGEASAVDRVRAEQELRSLKQRCDATMEALDLVLIPTIPRAYTRAELREQPVQRNSELGTYTNFMNLLDYAAVAVPAGALGSGLPWGVTLFGRAFTDHYVLAVADRFMRGADGNAGAATLIPGDRIRVVVCGAHLAGLPLNHQLLARSSTLVRATTTAAAYRLYALPGGPPFRPALVRTENGRCIDVEVWQMPSTELGSFLNNIGAPLGLGKIELDDGSIENGFICEHGALGTALDISHFGGWRAYLATLEPG